MAHENPSTNNIVLEAFEAHPLFLNIDDFRARLENGMSQSSEAKLLFSDQEFFGDYNHQNSGGTFIAQPFHDCITRAEVIAKLFERPKIILTPRRQDHWVQSSYMHFIIGFHTLGIDKYLSPGQLKGLTVFQSRSDKPALDYKSLDWSRYLEEYFRIFGRENVLAIPNEMLANDLPGTLKKICEFIGIETYIPSVPPPHINRSYSALSYRITMLTNRFVFNGINRFGFIPNKPFLAQIQRMRAKKDNRLLWFLAGISRRMTMRWLLHDVVDRYAKAPVELLGDSRRQEILAYHKKSNQRLSQQIGQDLSHYGYY